MKKISVLAVLFIAVCAVQPAFSQFLVGGGFSYQTMDEGTTKSSYSKFTVLPILLYEVSDKFDIGATFVYETYSRDVNSSDKDSGLYSDVYAEYKAFSIGPVVRYKFPTLGIFTPYIYGDLTFGMLLPDESGYDDGTGFAANLAVGGDLGLTDHVLFFIQLPIVGFSNQTIGDVSYTEFWTVTVNDLDAIQLGILFKF
ncbi:MAG: porin family protein [Treponema sp.]|jgi:hypothetical protein|nr:porin family protein [Treponema sp.]